jgi:hypothetical protein
MNMPNGSWHYTLMHTQSKKMSTITMGKVKNTAEEYRLLLYVLRGSATATTSGRIRQHMFSPKSFTSSGI